MSKFDIIISGYEHEGCQERGADKITTYHERNYGVVLDNQIEHELLDVHRNTRKVPKDMALNQYQYHLNIKYKI